MAITDYNQTWEGETGANVKLFITSKLLANETAAQQAHDNSIVNITAGYKPIEGGGEDKTTIRITGIKGNGDQIHADFKTVTEAAFNQWINEKEDPEFYTCKEIIPVGTDLEIPYDYYVEKDGLKLKGYKGDVTFTIVSSTGTKVYNTTTYTSQSSSIIRSGIFTIPASYLGIGTNTINMSVVTTAGNTQTTAYIQLFTTYVASIKLSVNIPEFEMLRPSSGQNADFNIQFSVKDANGMTIPNNIPYKTHIYVTRIHSNYESGNGVTGTSLLSVTYYSLLQATNQYRSISAAEIGPEIALIFRTSIETSLTDDQNRPIEVVSNTVYTKMLNSTALNSNSVSSGLYSAIKLNSVEMENNNSLVSVRAKQYETLTFDAYLFAKGVDQNYTISIDNIAKASGVVPVSSNTTTALSYSYIFRNSGVFDLDLAGLYFRINIDALNTSLHEPTNPALDLNASEKAVGTSDDNWTDGTTTCSFQDFDWVSNGWVSTPDGTALLLNNGARLTIDYKVCDASAYLTENYPFTVSIKYKVQNGFDLTEEIIKCANNTTGFVCKPTYVELKTSSVISQNISNDDVHEVTFVYYGNSNASGIYKGLQAIYIDGKILAITAAGAFVTHNNNIVIQGSTASIYIYSVKAYRRALSFTEIQSIYCFNQSDSSKIAAYVNANSIFSEDTTNIGNYSQNIDRTKLPKDSAILVLYGTERDPSSFKTINGYAKEEDKKKAIHELDHIMFYIQGYDAHPRNFYMHKGGLGAQGTSSMAYPVKNYRIYTNKKSKNVTYTVDCSVDAMYQGTSENPLPWNFNPETCTENELQNWFKPKYGKAFAYSLRSTDYGDDVTSAPANRFCLKADYAESSGTHNTGFARFANDVMKESTRIYASGFTSSDEDTKLPQQIAVEGNPSWEFDVRSNIDGFPVYLFFECPSYEDGEGVIHPAESYFCGRYNMNNDKSNVHVFGFESVTDYFNNPIVRAEGKVLQQKATLTGIDPNYAQTHCAAVDDEFINPIECWEFTSNEGISSQIGSFKYDWQTAFDVTTGEADSEVKTISNGLAWINTTWECRYPDINGAVKGGKDDNQEELPYRNGTSKPYLLYQTYKFLNQNNYSLHPNIQTLNNFAEQLHLYFNLNSVIKYFVLTHWFVSADQRIKNSMLSFYCDPYGVSEEEAEDSPLHYMRAYYIFYDNDTILGLNNSGAIKQPWDFYETDTGLFDGTQSKYATEAYTEFPGNNIHGIWTNLQKCYELYRDGLNVTSSAYTLGSLINLAYVNLRTKADDSTLEKYFEEDQCNTYPAAVHNIDLELKYLNPNITSTNTVEIPCHLDMAQGTREFHRKNWLHKRTLWLDDLYGVNVRNYALRYKTANTTGYDHGTIRLQCDPAFRYWRFYGANGTSNWKTAFLTPSDTGTITIAENPNGTLSQSDYFTICGLYGCKTIDFSNFTFDVAGFGTCDAGDLGFALPYLQTFIMRRYEDNNVVINSDSGSVLTWINPTILPNLKQLYFCHIHPSGSGSFSKYLLRNAQGNECTNLEVLDMRDTPISEVVLPNSSSLTSLSLDNPTILTIINKLNISTINIGTSNLDQLVVNTSSSVVYQWALSAAIARYGQAHTLTITFGNGPDHPYIIDNTNNAQLTLLDQLAQAYLADTTGNLSISGHIYTTEEYDSENISDAFPALNISSQMSSDGFSFGLVGDLYEDSVTATFDNNVVSNLSDLNCLEVRSNMPVASWSIEVDGSPSNTLNDRIKIVKTQAQKCWIHADPYNANAKIGGVDHSLRIIATLADGTTYNTFEINGIDPTIYYKPITSINITTDKEYTGDNATLTFDFGEHTKQHLLTRTNVESNPSDFQLSATNSATATLRYNADGILVGVLVTVYNADTTVTTNILSVTKTIDVYYDSYLIQNFNDVTETSPLYWIKCLAQSAQNEYTISDNFKKSTAAQIQIFNNVKNYWSMMLEMLANVSTAQDFTYLQYFQLGSTTDGKFTIPAISFTNLVTPKNTTSVEWTLLATDPSSHGLIKLGSTVKKLCVQLGFSGTLPNNLQFDLSDTQITKIGAYGSSVNNIQNYVASVQLTATLNNVSSVRSTSLFIYPTTLVELGNTDKTSESMLGSSPATLLFNLNDGNSGGVPILNNASPKPVLSLLDGFDVVLGGIKLGAITSYRSKNSAITTSWAKVREIDKAFVYYNNVNVSDGVFTLPSVLVIGPDAFYVDPNYTQPLDITFTRLHLNGAVLSIGYRAFNRIKFTIHNNSNTAADIAEFNNVTSIGEDAFYQASVSQSLKFGNALTSVGARAFHTENTGVLLKIYINKTDALENVTTTSFGLENSNTEIYVPEGSALWTLLTASGNEYKNKVHPLV